MMVKLPEIDAYGSGQHARTVNMDNRTDRVIIQGGGTTRKDTVR